MITIVVNHEDGQSDEFDFDSSHLNISVGRRSTNDVCIPNLSVSGRHARIVFNDGEAWIEDLNSTNGTYINNRLISRQMLNHNDELVIGKTRVRFENSEAGKTLDAEVNPMNIPADDSIDEAFDNIDPFDDSMQIGKVGESASSPVVGTPTPAPSSKLSSQSKPRVTPAQIAAAGTASATAVAAKGSSSEAMFESLADDLSERRADPLAEDVSRDEPSTPVDDDAPMTLSEKAKLALGRSSTRPTLAAVNGAAAAVKAPTAEAVAQADLDVQQEARPKSRPEETEKEKQTGAVIEIKNGAKSGQVLPIDKPVTTLGRPGIQIAAIMRKPDGYFLMHIESDDSVDRPTLNDDAIGDEPMLLQSGDELNVAGIDVEFNLA